MNKYHEIPCNNIISSYGGIGSIVETTEYSFIIQPLEKWTYYTNEISKNDIESIDELSIEDSRLIRRLQSYYSELSHLIRVPKNSTDKGGNGIENSKNLLSAELFPTWLYCPHCKCFMHLRAWKDVWRSKHERSEFKMTCPYCQKTKMAGKNKDVPLEQVRFVQISDDGDIRDFPWVEWFDMRTNSSNQCKHEFLYKTSPYSENLESINITCKKCQQTATLSGIFDSYKSFDKFRTVIKTSNSIYFPTIFRSLMIPISDSKFVNEPSELEYRCHEFDYMKDEENQQKNEDSISLKQVSIKRPFELTSIRYLTMNSVLCSYSRNQPANLGGFFTKGRSQHVTVAGIKTKYLPAVQSVGEGFLLTVDNKYLLDRYNQALKSSEFEKRIKIHKETLANFDPLQIASLDQFVLYKYIVLHTISHLVIKQLEYHCGYSAASLNERIYVSGKSHAGTMIYTVAGSDGSYGGIVSVVEKKGFEQTLKDAFERAKFCANDPVCYHNDFSVCFACTLLPETTCEVFNNLLDRSLITDEQYGIIQSLDL